MMRSASVIVPSIGRTERLRECIGAILRQNTDASYEVIVVVDGPDAERTVSDLQATFPEESRIRFDASVVRRGSPAAKNLGAAMARGEVLVFVDDDAVPTNGWLRSILNSYSDGIVGVGGSEEKQGSSGVLRKVWFHLWGNVTGKVTRSGLVLSNFDPRKSTAERVDCLPGSNMSFLRDAFQEVGGFDTNYKGTAYREETDLCLRIKGNSCLLFVPSAKVLHYEERTGGNTPESVRDWNYWYHRNNTYFFLKNLRSESPLSWTRHLLVELLIAAARVLQQRAFYPLSTIVTGIRDGRKAFIENG